jgi:hypothetical protein
MNLLWLLKKIHYQEIKHFSIWRSGKNICFFFPKLMDMENKQWSFSCRWLIFCHFSYAVKLLAYCLLASLSLSALGILRPVNRYCKMETFHKFRDLPKTLCPLWLRIQVFLLAELILSRVIFSVSSVFRIWDFHSGGCEEFCLLGYNAVQSIKSWCKVRPAR